MRIKIGRVIFITFLFCILSSINVWAKDNFSGSRKITGYISRSDLQNYVDGGRTSLNQVLAKDQREWFTCTVTSKENDVYLTLDFEFSSYDDYVKKVEFLLGDKPITTYGNEDMAYVENFLPIELFGFLSDAMQEAELTSEMTFISMLQAKDSTTILNNKQYNGTRALNTEDNPIILFDGLEIITDVAEDGYVREVYLDVSELYQEDTESVLKQRADLCEADFAAENTGRYVISFFADSEEMMVKKTMLLLGTAVNITHEKYGVSSNEIKIKTNENINVTSILSEEGTYQYEITLPESCRDLGIDLKENGQANPESVNGQRITYTGREGEVVYYYNQDLLLDELVIITDISDEWKRISRAIVIKLDGSLADQYTKQIREKLEEVLGRGDSIRIYDDGGERCFEVKYASWFEKDIAEFTERILGVSEAKVLFQRNMLPFFSSQIEEQWTYPEKGFLLENKEIQMQYLTSDELLQESVKVNGSNGQKILVNREYKGFYPKKLFLFLMTCTLILVSCIILVHYGRKHMKKLSVMWKSSHLKKCPKCGAKREKRKKFCGKCGYKF